MLALILFVFGLVLWWRGRFSFGSIDTQGRHVKAAGLVLMLPEISVFVLGILATMILGPERGAALLLSGLVFVLGMIAMIVSATIAYILIADPPQAPRLPGVLGDLQAERRGTARPNQTVTPPQTNETVNEVRPTPPEKPAAPSAPARPAQRHPLERYATPAATTQRPAAVRNIMTVREAADYMAVPQAEIMAWIEGGKLPAARGNGGFVIARSLLDEMKQNKSHTENMQPA